MRIIPVTTNTKQTNFNGLWGETIPRRRFDGYCVESTTTKEYHPFKGETIVEIDKAIAETQKYNKLGKEQVYVTVKKTLDITEQEFNTYKESKLVNKLATKVENVLKSANLTKHINKIV